MNKVVLMGRLTKDPTVRTTAESKNARFTLAVDRKYSKNGEADFISCVAFGKTADFVETYLHKATKIVVAGRIQTGSYTNKDGQKVYTTDVILDEIEFAESKKSSGENQSSQPAQPEPPAQPDNSANEEADASDEELPWN